MSIYSLQSSGRDGLGRRRTSSRANSATNPQHPVNASKPCSGPSSKRLRIHIINHCPTFIRGLHVAVDKHRSWPEQVQGASGSRPCSESHPAFRTSLHSPACSHSASPGVGNCRTSWGSCYAQPVTFQSFLRCERTPLSIFSACLVNQTQGQETLTLWCESCLIPLGPCLPIHERGWLFLP